MTGSTNASSLDDLDRAILNRLQLALPLVSRPFAAIALELGCDEDDLIDRTRQLHRSGYITRFGPFLDAEAMGGAFCLCAIAAPEEQFDRIAEIVNGFDEVAHNYQREHTLNMWFVLATDTPEAIQGAAHRIEVITGCRVHLFPKEREFFIGFKVAA
jgi:DNA-binding Lrp family transcriptional regulator